MGFDATSISAAIFSHFLLLSFQRTVTFTQLICKYFLPSSFFSSSVYFFCNTSPAFAVAEFHRSWQTRFLLILIKTKQPRRFTNRIFDFVIVTCFHFSMFVFFLHFLLNIVLCFLPFNVLQIGMECFTIGKTKAKVKVTNKVKQDICSDHLRWRSSHLSSLKIFQFFIINVVHLWSHWFCSEHLRWRSSHLSS